MGGAVVTATLTWVSSVVWRTHGIPDLSGPAIFIGAAAGGHYAINQASGIVDAFRGKADKPNA